MKFWIGLIAIFFLMSSASAQIEIRPSAFYVDHASFASDEADISILEVYYKIHTSHLSHIIKDGKYFAGYSVSAVILKDKKQIDAIENEGSLYSETYEETQNDDSYVVNTLKFPLKPGKYGLEITLHDLNADNSIPLAADIEVASFEREKAAISDIEFAGKVLAVDAETSNFDKGDWQVIPSCSRRYGDRQTQLRFYYELYMNNNTARDFQIIYRIATKKNDVVLSRTVDGRFKKEAGHIDSLSLVKLKPGPYRFVISVVDSSNDKIVEKSAGFSLVWSALELVKNDFEAAVEQLAYIASTDEMNQLRKAPEDNRIEEWNSFWQENDPSPGTAENELKDEYYRRLAYANEQYGLPIKEGWKTDMGMIYIINGEPDEIERHPFDIETKPYEIWYFYSPRRRFLFIDVRGYGEYELQYPYDGDINKRINIYGGGP
jgi:GWxTD domain-containing protein